MRLNKSDVFHYFFSNHNFPFLSCRVAGTKRHVAQSAAGGASGPVDAKHASAFGAFPAGLLLFDKIADALGFYEGEVFEHAHAISGAVALVQMLQPLAGIGFAVKTVFPPAPAWLPAKFDGAFSAIPRLVRAGERAPLAVVCLPEVRQANSAIHAAGRDHG